MELSPGQCVKMPVVDGRFYCIPMFRFVFPMGEEGVGKRGGLGKSGVRRMPPPNRKCEVLLHKHKMDTLKITK